MINIHHRFRDKRSRSNPQAPNSVSEEDESNAGNKFWPHASGCACDAKWVRTCCAFRASRLKWTRLCLGSTSHRPLAFDVIRGLCSLERIQSLGSESKLNQMLLQPLNFQQRLWLRGRSTAVETSGPLQRRAASNRQLCIAAWASTTWQRPFDSKSFFEFDLSKFNCLITFALRAFEGCAFYIFHLQFFQVFFFISIVIIIIRAVVVVFAVLSREEKAPSALWPGSPRPPAPSSPTTPGCDWSSPWRPPPSSWSWPSSTWWESCKRWGSGWGGAHLAWHNPSSKRSHTPDRN